MTDWTPGMLATDERVLRFSISYDPGRYVRWAVVLTPASAARSVVGRGLTMADAISQAVDKLKEAA